MYVLIHFSTTSFNTVYEFSFMYWLLLILSCPSDLSPGIVCLKLFSGDLMIAEAKINYYTDMEEISNLLSNVTNPMEFMCQVKY